MGLSGKIRNPGRTGLSGFFRRGKQRYLFSFLAAQHSFFSPSFFWLQQDEVFSALPAPHDADVALPSFFWQQLFVSSCFAQDFSSAFVHVCSVFGASFLGFESFAAMAKPNPVPTTAITATLNKTFFIFVPYLELMWLQRK
jgi:hypothetical protein